MYSSIQCVKFNNTGFDAGNIPYTRIIIITDFKPIIIDLFNMWVEKKTWHNLDCSRIEREKTLYIFFVDPYRAIEAFQFLKDVSNFISSYLKDLETLENE